MSHEWLIQDQGMPNKKLMTKAKLQGYISSIPSQIPHKTQFQFATELLNGNPVQATILLSCYEHCPILHSGEYWQLIAKIKQPINLGNPGAFDYVGWLFSRHIHWVGMIDHRSFLPLSNPKKHYPLTRLRESLEQHLLALKLPEETLGIFEALTIGLTNHVDKSQWDLFRRTGTTHLIDISGEHITLIAGLSYGIIKWLWRYTGVLCLTYPAPKIASFGAILISFAYTLITGFAVPTQRSFITCCFILCRGFIHQKMSVWQCWRYALFVVLLFEPHAVYMLGFYFSFLAVAILILVNQRMVTKGIRHLLALQVACLLGLMPLSLYWFSYGSLNGFIANIFAIPWVSFLIVPLALIIAFLSPWIVIPGSVILLKTVISALLYALLWIDSFPIGHVDFTFTQALSPLILIAAMGILSFFPRIRLFPAAIVLLLAGLSPKYERIRYGEATIDVMDVGQGLSVIIRTHNHIMIYDTGIKWLQGNDMGTLAIIPYLNTLGIKTLDKIIISHPDLDHRGGLESLSKKYPVKELLVDDPHFYKKGLSCHAYPSWAWDGISFRFFPITMPFKSKNNHSCILQITRGTEAVLLSGDIEQSAETYLIQTYGPALQSSVLIIPHHASKTSSSEGFVKTISPRYAIASYGFDNRYHFPHKEALRSYEKYDIPVYSTLDCGMSQIQLGSDQTGPRCYRQ